MSRTSARQRVQAAERDLVAARLKLRNDLAPWKAALRRHRVAVTLLGGFGSGALAALIPLRRWIGVGAVGMRFAASVARAALKPAVAGAAVSGLRSVVGHRA